MRRATVFYDDSCGFCRWSAERLRAWDRGRRLRFAPLNGAEADAALGDLDPQDRATSWHLVTPDGRTRSAGAAVPETLRRLPGGGPLASLAVAFPGVTDDAYRWVSRHRGAFGRVLRRRACDVDPSRSER